MKDPLGLASNDTRRRVGGPRANDARDTFTKVLTRGDWGARYLCSPALPHVVARAKAQSAVTAGGDVIWLWAPKWAYLAVN